MYRYQADLTGGLYIDIGQVRMLASQPF